MALHTAFPTAQESGGATSTVTDKKSGTKGSTKDIPDEPPEGPWLATQAYFRQSPAPLLDENKPAALRDQTGVVLRNLFGVPAEARIYSIVATVPDPLHTRLALLFDETIDAIERGAEHQ